MSQFSVASIPEAVPPLARHLHSVPHQHTKQFEYSYQKPYYGHIYIKQT